MSKLRERQNLLKNLPYEEFARRMRDKEFSRRVIMDQSAYLALIKQGYVQSWPGAILSMAGPVFLALGILALFLLPPYVGGILLAAAPTCLFSASIVTRRTIWREFKGQGKLPTAEVKRLYETAVANNLLWMYDNN